MTDSSAYDGFTALHIFGSKRTFYAYTYDDVILLPGYVESNSEISLETSITRNIKIKLPLLSSPMDTVTGNCL